MRIHLFKLSGHGLTILSIGVLLSLSAISYQDPASANSKNSIDNAAGSNAGNGKKDHNSGAGNSGGKRSGGTDTGVQGYNSYESWLYDLTKDCSDEEK